ncbi:hypothetical protein [Rhizobacter sp. SG703]|uniref:hypothetical protein n=1 Tax=Rhizobacter sp. SG703 TaxID=2587140 RepID=UPI0014475457|nr:hypothetical protein [Rhizobacter sp. SG703]NKI95743.1 hypothetical protein [Rhizobacter sp. SG703]
MFRVSSLRSLKTLAKEPNANLVTVHNNFMRSSGKQLTDDEASQLKDASPVSQVMHDRVVDRLIDRYERLDDQGPQDWVKV